MRRPDALAPFLSPHQHTQGFLPQARRPIPSIRHFIVKPGVFIRVTPWWSLREVAPAAPAPRSNRCRVILRIKIVVIEFVGSMDAVGILTIGVGVVVVVAIVLAGFLFRGVSHMAAGERVSFDEFFCVFPALGFVWHFAFRVDCFSPFLFTYFFNFILLEKKGKRSGDGRSKSDTSLGTEVLKISRDLRHVSSLKR